jgi:phosphohistidine swiveling domain-containing protein
MLNSFVEERIINSQEKYKFLNSVKTINKEMQLDLINLTNKKFVNKYGHLRPNTYEISSKNYRENFKNYFKKTKKMHKKKSNSEFKFKNKQIKKINDKLKENNLKISANELIKFIKESIELREYSKFIFTKSIDLIFSNLKKFGEKYKINKEDLSYLNINTILDLHYNLNVGETIKFLREEIKQNKKKYIINSKIILPEIIIEEKSLYLNKYSEAKINFITNQKISGNVINYSKSLDYNSLKNKILCIENADPGYDFVFNFEIKGLVTRFGGANSHMAIRCAELNIPALIGVGEKNFSNISNSNFIEIDCELKKYNLV